jgi:L-arabinokinase
MLAVAGAYEVTLDPTDAAVLCQRVENNWLRMPVGIGDAACVLFGEANTLMGLRCEPCTPCESLPLPDDVALVGIDCGSVHPDAKLKYEHVRTAAFMGCALIDLIIQHEGGGDVQWDGHLARVSIQDYVQRFRDRIPTKLKGSEYLERFGETGDPLTRVDPKFVYKVRSRAEHHIYEHVRACQFVECLSRAIHGDDKALAEAGELMYASHWSYGQRCGLGSIETDHLVNLIREHGVAAGIFGAKITGRGCGGVVAVLMRASDRATAAISSAIKVYQSQTGRVATVIRGSSPGALTSRIQLM